MATPKTQIVTKLSMKNSVGNVKTHLPDSRTDTDPVELLHVAGIARGSVSGESTFGVWTALTGDFICQPIVGENAGQRLRSGKLFLPDVALGLVMPHVDGLAKGEGVEVAFTITVKNDPNNEVGYSYGAAFLKEPEGGDPLENLIAGALPALPAPEAEEKKAPAKK